MHYILARRCERHTKFLAQSQKEKKAAGTNYSTHHVLHLQLLSVFLVNEFSFGTLSSTHHGKPFVQPVVIDGHDQVIILLQKQFRLSQGDHLNRKVGLVLVQNQKSFMIK